VLEYFILSSRRPQGACGYCIENADAGYLTRRLIDVAQEIIITEQDCGTMNGITVEAITEGNEVVCNTCRARNSAVLP